MVRISVSILVAVILVSARGARGEKHAYEGLLRLLSNYDKNEVPSKDRPTEVSIGLYINEMDQISARNMDYSMTLYLRQQWTEPRLKNSTDGKQALRLPHGAWDTIWVPDTFIRNEKRSAFHETTVSNRLMKVDRGGKVWYVMRLSLTVSCPMNLGKFPFDTQSCSMIFESFGYTMDQMYFGWLPQPVDINPGVVGLDNFFLVDTFMLDCSQNYTSGAYPCLEVRFILRRSSGYYLLYYYLPTALIVVMSWLSFWISFEHSAIRVPQGLLLMLTMTILSICVPFLFDLPRVSYVKAVDVWNIFCLTFIFASLLEHCVVGVLSSMGNGGLFEVLCGCSAPVAEGQHNENVGSSKAGKQGAVVIDKVCRWVFPVAFLLFVVVYFIAYNRV